jgi:prepilin-type N-terminal cleavage/methylation domain-containing protein
MINTAKRLQRRREELGDHGFTLIELLIVIVILGILAAIVVFAVDGVTGSSAQAACRSDWKTVETAVEAYDAQVAAYPASIADLATSTTINGATVGPWINTNDLSSGTLVNTDHYQIVLSGTQGAISVLPWNSGSSTYTGGDTSGTQSDCNAVK